jgi:uncharacterized protein (DUF433 family)
MENIDWRDYIHSDPDILVGKPVVKGTRLSVEFILGLYSAGWTEQQVLENYPRLTSKDIQAVFSYKEEQEDPIKSAKGFLKRSKFTSGRFMKRKQEEKELEK